MRGTSVQKQQAVKPVLPPCYEKKNRIYLEKTQENNKKTQTLKTFKKSQNRIWNACYR